MRNSMLVLAVLLAVPLSAQSIDKPTRISAFVSNVSGGFSEGNRSALDAGVGVALEHRWSRQWSGEFSVSRETHTDSSFSRLEVFKVTTYPVDAVGRYSFTSVHTRWRPYVGLGARYVAAPSDAPDYTHYDDQLSAEAAGGVEFNATDAWSLRFDVKQLLREDTEIDDAFKVSLGIGWRF